MRTRIVIGIVLASMILLGCKAGKIVGRGGTKSNSVFLTVDFEQEQTLRYKFVSYRDILLDWNPGAADSANRIQKQSERLEMIVAYTALEVDPYGISTIQATCESVQVQRSGRPSGRGANSDAVSAAQGQTFVLKVDPRGKIIDASSLEKLIKQLGAGAFRDGASGKRIKEQDLVGDFIISQWFLWDTISSVPNPAEGIMIGQSWKSKLSVPTPMVTREARDVTYRLDEVRESEDEKLAVITGIYRLAEKTPRSWPIPYSGRFQMSGTFGFLGTYKISSLEGTGREVFNVNAGRIETSEQNYTMKMKAALPPIGIRANPSITIEQKLTMERLAP